MKISLENQEKIARFLIGKKLYYIAVSKSLNYYIFNRYSTIKSDNNESYYVIHYHIGTNELANGYNKISTMIDIIKNYAYINESNQEILNQIKDIIPEEFI